MPGAKERDPQRAGPDAPAVPDLGDVAQMAAEAGEAMSAGADAPAPVYGWSQGSATTRHSGDGRFTVEAHKGPVFKAYDAWTGEESRIYSDEAAALAWCRERIPADALAWTDYGAAHVTELSGSKFVVTVLGVDRPRFYATDVRLPVGSRERSSPIFDALETAKRWCEVRACCAVAPGLDPDRPALAYQSPVAF